VQSCKDSVARGISGATVLGIEPLDQPEGIDVMNGTRTSALDSDVYTIAYLAGGPSRAVDAAVVALVGSGHLEVDDETGRLSVTDTQRHHWLEAAILDGVGTRDYRTVQILQRRMRDDERLADIGGRLEVGGLLRRSARGSHRRRTWQTLALTREGRGALRDLRAEPPVDRIAPGTDAMAVALGGPAALQDAALRRALFDPPAPPGPPSRRELRREIHDARLGLSTSAAAATLWVAGSEDSAWIPGSESWGGGSGGWGDGGGWGGGDGGGGGGDGGG
jgi:uncharacterized membrane protein YgcG